MASAYDAVNPCRRIVSQVRRIDYWVPRVILGACLLLGALNFLTGLLQAQLKIGSLLLGLVGGWLLSIVLNWLVRLIVLRPMKALRFGVVMRELSGRAARFHVQDSYRWSRDSPGMMLALTDERLLICSEETDYEDLQLSASQIAEVRMEREAVAHAITRERGRFTIGGGSRLFGAWTFGGKSRSTTRVVETIFLEIAVHGGAWGRTGSVVVPFGPDRRTAESWRVMIEWWGKERCA